MLYIDPNGCLWNEKDVQSNMKMPNIHKTTGEVITRIRNNHKTILKDVGFFCVNKNLLKYFVD